ncbi:conserved Plasmodium protein, unknown function [Plasmodium gonderi]|uniref:Uncharacterized protein n=1 Tax=Plasmodium gonderi TaxID=77519 RepID=A0A1Y1JQF7_PLAGO|nr:conserved Plasmodium protein, unknown function [Plasmodium gonderi]GAW82304.1 conserved Plasmodium protein, unknown function [Plasmodium gonderi]
MHTRMNIHATLLETLLTTLLETLLTTLLETLLTTLLETLLTTLLETLLTTLLAQPQAQVHLAPAEGKLGREKSHSLEKTLHSQKFIQGKFSEEEKNGIHNKKTRRGRQKSEGNDVLLQKNILEKKSEKVTYYPGFCKQLGTTGRRCMLELIRRVYRKNTSICKNILSHKIQPPTCISNLPFFNINMLWKLSYEFGVFDEALKIHKIYEQNANSFDQFFKKGHIHRNSVQEIKSTPKENYKETKNGMHSSQVKKYSTNHSRSDANTEEGGTNLYPSSSPIRIDKSDECSVSCRMNLEKMEKCNERRMKNGKVQLGEIINGLSIRREKKQTNRKCHEFFHNNSWGATHKEDKRSPHSEPRHSERILPGINQQSEENSQEDDTELLTEEAKKMSQLYGEEEMKNRKKNMPKFSPWIILNSGDISKECPKFLSENRTRPNLEFSPCLEKKNAQNCNYSKERDYENQNSYYLISKDSREGEKISGERNTVSVVIRERDEEEEEDEAEGEATRLKIHFNKNCESCRMNLENNKLRIKKDDINVHKENINIDEKKGRRLKAEMSPYTYDIKNVFGLNSSDVLSSSITHIINGILLHINKKNVFSIKSQKKFMRDYCLLLIPFKKERKRNKTNKKDQLNSQGNIYIRNDKPIQQIHRGAAAYETNFNQNSSFNSTNQKMVTKPNVMNNSIDRSNFVISNNSIRNDKPYNQRINTHKRKKQCTATTSTEMKTKKMAMPMSMMMTTAYPFDINTSVNSNTLEDTSENAHLNDISNQTLYQQYSSENIDTCMRKVKHAGGRSSPKLVPALGTSKRTTLLLADEGSTSEYSNFIKEQSFNPPLVQSIESGSGGVSGNVDRSNHTGSNRNMIYTDRKQKDTHKEHYDIEWKHYSVNASVQQIIKQCVTDRKDNTIKLLNEIMANEKNFFNSIKKKKNFKNKIINMPKIQKKMNSMEKNKKIEKEDLINFLRQRDLQNSFSNDAHKMCFIKGGKKMVMNFANGRRLENVKSLEK